MNPILSKNETDSMRGVAILFIMLHNLLHWKVNTIENEYTFVLDRSQLFMEQLKEFNGSLWQDICSFLGGINSNHLYILINEFYLTVFDYP